MPNWGIRSKIFFTVLLSIMLSIGITTTINIIRVSKSFIQTTEKNISLISDNASRFALAQISHHEDLLTSITMSENLKAQLRTSNEMYSNLSDAERIKQVMMIEETWNALDEGASSFIESIQLNITSAYLRRFQTIHPDEVEIFITNAYGMNVSMSNQTSDYWQADESWWQETIEGKTFISDPVYDESSHTWALIIAIPVFDLDWGGEVIGVVRGTLDITSILDSIFIIDENQSGSSVFISNDGYAYYELDGELEILPMPEQFQAFVDQAEHTFVGELNDVNGTSSIASISRLGDQQQSLGWILISIPRSEIVQLLFTTIIGNIIIGLLLTLLLGALSLVLSNSILTVLKDLKQDAYHLSIGDYSYRFSEDIIKSNDPNISSLVDSFDKMKTAIQYRESEIRTREKQFRQLVETMSEGLAVVDEKGLLTYVNPRLCQILGYKSEEILGGGFKRFFPKERQTKLLKEWKSRLENQHNTCESVIVTQSGEHLDVSISMKIQHSEDGKYTGVLAVIMDISARKKYELSLTRKLNEISGLRAIDTAILEKNNFQGVVTTVLDQFKQHLAADAAAIYVFKPGETAVQYASGYFLEEKIPFTEIQTDGEYILHLSGVTEAREINSFDESHLICDALREKHFNVTYIKPIMINEIYHGVVSIFYFDKITLDEEWLNYFGALITQTAVGISKIELMNNLQIRNVELKEAYDGIIKGWAKALELRDKETKGHSDRVVEFSIKMAERCGFENTKLEAFKRGALLHDIGKMGIPDSILLKPGKLNNEEWEIMKLHPDLAYVLLAEIPFLKEAVEIPYYHHERWDGSGYPSGLKGEAIPLAARIFAVSDVWDALTGDRPYRSAWSKEKTREYLIENKRVLFDPDLVDQFLDLLADEGII